MPSKYNRNHRKPILTIVEGGERTYIHPYSYYEDLADLSNRIHFLQTPEFPVHQEQGSGPEDYCYYYQYSISLLRKGWDIVRRFLALLKTQRKYKLGLRHWAHLWNTTTPVFCADIYRGSTISVPGTLSPSFAGSKLTDTFYLIPSQEWIKRKLENWLFGKDGSYPNSYLSEVRNSYLTWAGSQVKMGRKIAFLTSLDT